MRSEITKIIVTILIILITDFVMADTPITVSTFNCISLYWSMEGGSADQKVLVKYRQEGDANWDEGLSMKYNPIDETSNDIADYRGSIVNLSPNTVYEIELFLEGTSLKDTVKAKTWSEVFPIGKTIKVGNRTTQYNITESGTEDAWILIDGTGSTIDVNNSSYYCIVVSASYVIIRGFKLKGASRHGIYFNDCHDIVVENCDISGWGRRDDDGFGKNYEAALYSVSDKLARVVVQRNLIHHPRWDSNSWAEDNKDSYHPQGPQGISFENSVGNHVIRYNEIWSDKDHMFNDVIGFGSNASYEGFPGTDTDIYCNYIGYCWDDGIESEGANRNVRIWGNYIEEVYTAIGNAPVSVGPLYVWKNVSGRSYSPTGSKYGEYGKFLKMGYAGDLSYMTGQMYIFNNTILQPNGEGTGGLGTNYDSNRHIRHCQSRNNIFHVHDIENSISTRDVNIDFDYDYDLCNQGYPDGQEINGIKGIPVYTNNAGFDFKTMTANFSLDSISPGYNAGAIIPNFVEQYEGDAPDIGAFEAGQVPLEYGIHAYLNTVPLNYRLRVSREGSGNVIPLSGAYEVGEQLTVTATPDDEYIFDHWEGDLTGNTNPTTLTMIANMNITAVFKGSATNITDDLLSAYSILNYPNPFNTLTTIEFNLPRSGHVNITVYDMTGRKTAQIVNSYFNAGSYTVDWTAKDNNGQSLSIGVYVVVMKSGNYSKSIKMILIR